VPIIVPNIRNATRVFRHRFLDEQDIQSACAVPFVFSDGERGALTVYRDSLAPQFQHEDVDRIVHFAAAVPVLYEAVRERVGFRLIRDVDEILHKAHLEPAAEEFSKEPRQTVAKAVCERLRQTFRCVEASLFLEDKAETPGTYRVVATTWPPTRNFPPAYTRQTPGITGWVIAHGRSVRVFDLKNFKRDIDFYRRHYEGIEWRNSLDVEEVASEVFDVPPDKAATAELYGRSAPPWQ
jgi:hypothetical protein